MGRGFATVPSNNTWGREGFNQTVILKIIPLPLSTGQLEHKALQLTPELLEQKQVFGIVLSTWNDGFCSFGSLCSAQNPHPSKVFPSGHVARTFPIPFAETRLYSGGESIQTAAHTPPFLM